MTDVLGVLNLRVGVLSRGAGLGDLVAGRPGNFQVVGGDWGGHVRGLYTFLTPKFIVSLYGRLWG